MIETPDYEKYTTEQLVDVAAHINRARHPQRWALIEAELRVRAARGEDVSESAERSSLVLGVAWCSALGFFVVPLLAYLSIFLLLPRNLSNQVFQQPQFDAALTAFPAGWLIGWVAGTFFHLRAPHQTHWLRRLPQCFQGAALSLFLVILLAVVLFFIAVGVVIVLIWFSKTFGW